MRERCSRSASKITHPAELQKSTHVLPGMKCDALFAGKLKIERTVLKEKTESRKKDPAEANIFIE